MTCSPFTRCKATERETIEVIVGSLAREYQTAELSLHQLEVAFVCAHLDSNTLKCF